MTGGMIAIYLLIVIIIFLVCREIVCWYWKINQNLALLTEIRDLLKFQSQNTVVLAANPDGNATGEKKPVVFQPGKWECLACKGKNETGDVACRYCSTPR